jgi:hypothetical protein
MTKPHASPDAPPTEPLTEDQADDATKSARELIRSESDLLHQRVTWLLQIQGLLFAALAFAWNVKSTQLVVLFCVLGIATAVSIATALHLYSPAVRQIQGWWTGLLSPAQRRHRRIIGYDSRSRGLKWLLRPWRSLPYVFVVAWVFVLVTSLWR